MQNGYLAKTGELCEVQGHIGLYLDERLPDIDGLARYECIEADEVEEYIYEIREAAVVNFSGSILLKTPLDGSKSIAPGRWKGFTDDNEEDGFLGMSLTIGEFIAMTEDEIRELVD